MSFDVYSNVNIIVYIVNHFLYSYTFFDRY